MEDKNSLSTHAASETNEETLREMTGAPDINQPLISKEAFSDIDVSSSRPLWKLPLPKLGLIAAVLVPVFGAAGYFLAGGRSTSQVVSNPVISQEPVNIHEEENSELQQAEQEIATLKAQIALDDQAYIQETQRPSLTSAPQDQQSTVSDTATEPSKTQTVSAPPPSTPPIISSTSSPSVIQSSDRSIASLSALPDRFTSRNPFEQNPFEQWQQLAQLGSYGSVNSRNSDREENAEIVSQPNSSDINGSTLAAVPAAYFSQTSAIIPRYSSLNLRLDSSVTPSVDQSEQDDSARLQEQQSIGNHLSNSGEPEILTEAESRILSSQVLDTSGMTRSLIAGGWAAGELLTPVLLDSENINNRFVIVLTEPLTDNASQIAIPSGALLTIQVDRVSENGSVQLSATQAVWEEQSFQRELVLPRQTILIRGSGGNPLVAQSYGDIGGDIAAMDTGQFALGAIRRIGELYTRSDARVQSGDGTTIITESNPAPNILAGALEGGSEALLDDISERNQQAIERLQQRPNIPYLPAGTSVQVFINQSMQMPAG
ncbi:MAG: hypothetical protein AAFY33_07040 [Cyanobacteria bacterium J06643_4]